MTTIETIHGASAARTGRHVLKRILAALAVATCMLDASAANQAPSVAMQSPVNGASYAAPAAVTLVASASDSDGSIARVEFFNGAELLGTSTSAPYQFTWTGVPAGTYAVTARATDDLGGQTTTAVATVTVTSGGAQVYFVYSDQINTPKEIINAAGVKVWQGDSEPFGANPPMENPAGQGVFTYNLRFPGQYFDRETGLHYNYHRDYDPQTGRYVQSDPIGLEGGINTYGYVGGNPLSFTDPKGKFAIPAVVIIGALVAGTGGALWWQQTHPVTTTPAFEWTKSGGSEPLEAAIPTPGNATPSSLERLARSCGWTCEQGKGHLKCYGPNGKGYTTIPRHDLNSNTARGIIKEILANCQSKKC